MMEPEAALQSRATYRRAAGSLAGDMGGEKVMMSVSTGKYYNLGRVGGRIWELLEQPMTLDRLVDQLTSEYDVERGVCEEQVRSFLDRLCAEGLIEAETG